MKRKTIFIIITSVIVIAATSFFLLKPKRVNADEIEIETGFISKGRISNSVTATGTLEAITTVDVGTQVSGIIENLYVDFNSYVKQGQLLARLDTTNLAAAVEQTLATVNSAKAEMDYQKANFVRLDPLYKKQLVSQATYDEVVYNLNRTKASYKNALAQHRKNLINLDFALIHSPIDGIVLSRAVEEGQTVASNFETPTLFTIANDLTQMQVEANVDEADIGQVKQGQRVEFTVDAYPNQTFEGEITEVRLEPTVTNNVVTYTIIIAAPNPDYKLMPGMTAETNIYVIEKTDILVAPSKAARFMPEPELLMAYMGDNAPPKREGRPEGNRPEGQRPEMGEGEHERQMLWVKRDSVIMPVPVKLGMDDDINIEIIEGLNEGDEVILKMEEKVEVVEKKASSGNPFMPTPPQRRR